MTLQPIRHEDAFGAFVTALRAVHRSAGPVLRHLPQPTPTAALLSIVGSVRVILTARTAAIADRGSASAVIADYTGRAFAAYATPQEYGARNPSGNWASLPAGGSACMRLLAACTGRNGDEQLPGQVISPALPPGLGVVMA